VPTEETISNRSNGYLAEGSEECKRLFTEFQQTLSHHEIDELFYTLAQWNDYLENHIPYFQEIHRDKDEDVREEMQP